MFGGICVFDVFVYLCDVIGMYVVVGLMIDMLECCYGNVVLLCCLICVVCMFDLLFYLCELCGVFDVDIDCGVGMICVVVIYFGLFVSECSV